MLALEEVFVREALKEQEHTGTSRPFVFTYQFVRPTVVLGNRMSSASVNVDYCNNHDFAITKRNTGGGNVLAWPDDISYTFYFPQPFTRVHEEFVVERLRTALDKAGVYTCGIHGERQSYIRVPQGDVLKSFVFPAMRKFNQTAYWHHGFVTATDEPLGHVQQALGATAEELSLMRERTHTAQSNSWRPDTFIESLAPPNSIALRASQEDVKQADNLRVKRYENPQRLEHGESGPSVCNVPDGTFDREAYTTEELNITGSS